MRLQEENRVRKPSHSVPA